MRAYLEGRHESWLTEFAAHLEATRAPGLTALADALRRWFDAGNFNGCAFINVTAESAEDEWRRISCRHEDTLRELIVSRTPPRLPPGQRARLAARALLVVEGVIVRYQMTRDSKIVDDGREVLALLAQHAGTR